MSRRYAADALAGARAMLPWLAAVTPFGLVIGVSAGQASISNLAGWLTAAAIYGGSAQVAAIQLLDAGAAALTVLVTVLTINLRLVLYSAALSRYWKGTPLWWRLLAGYLLIDPSFVVGMGRYSGARGEPAAARAVDADLRPAHAYYSGAAALLWVGWLAAVAVGTIGGAAVPAGWHLELLVPLYLVGQIVPQLRRRPSRRTVLVSGCVAAACVAAPLHLGIAVAIACGLVAGSVAARAGRRSPVAETSVGPAAEVQR
jgi:predicted branched-subunit amino acid permease